MRRRPTLKTSTEDGEIEWCSPILYKGALVRDCFCLRGRVKRDVKLLIAFCVHCCDNFSLLLGIGIGTLFTLSWYSLSLYFFLNRLWNIFGGRASSSPSSNSSVWLVEAILCDAVAVRSTSQQNAVQKGECRTQLKCWRQNLGLE